MVSLFKCGFITENRVDYTKFVHLSIVGGIILSALVGFFLDHDRDLKIWQNPPKDKLIQ